MEGIPKKLGGEIYAFDTTEELVGRISKDTGVSPDAVRKILRLSFPSTKKYIMREFEKNAASFIRQTIGAVEI